MEECLHPKEIYIPRDKNLLAAVQRTIHLKGHDADRIDAPYSGALGNNLFRPPSESQWRLAFVWEKNGRNGTSGIRHYTTMEGDNESLGTLVHNLINRPKAWRAVVVCSHLPTVDLDEPSEGPPEGSPKPPDPPPPSGPDPSTTVSSSAQNPDREILKTPVAKTSVPEHEPPDLPFSDPFKTPERIRTPDYSTPPTDGWNTLGLGTGHVLVPTPAIPAMPDLSGTLSEKKGPVPEIAPGEPFKTPGSPPLLPPSGFSPRTHNHTGTGGRMPAEICLTLLRFRS